MAPPSIPADFDFLDPDVNLAGLPVAELAELRKSEPVHWVDIPDGSGGFEDGGLLGGVQTHGRQRGLAAQRRLLQPGRTAQSRLATRR